jgi:hypothetical protein
LLLGLRVLSIGEYEKKSRGETPTRKNKRPPEVYFVVAFSSPFSNSIPFATTLFPCYNTRVFASPLKEEKMANYVNKEEAWPPSYKAQIGDIIMKMHEAERLNPTKTATVGGERADSAQAMEKLLRELRQIVHAA